MCVYGKDLQCEDIENCPENSDAVCFQKKEVILRLSEAMENIESSLMHYHLFKTDPEIQKIISRLKLDLGQL
jgi:hypothetical protein